MSGSRPLPFIAQATLPDLLGRISLWDLFENPDCPTHVDWRAITTFDPQHKLHAILAETVAEAALEYLLVQREFSRASEPLLDASPLDVRYSRGMAQAEIFYDSSVGELAGQRVFLKRAGTTAEEFRPGRWLQRLAEIQREGRERLDDLIGRLKEKRLESASSTYQALDDSAAFGEGRTSP